MPEARDESFARRNRLSNSRDFKRTFSKGKRAATPYFVIYCLPNHLPVPRLGIQVKAKIGTAVKRNYIKRIVREVFRKMKNELKEPVDIIFIAEKVMAKVTFRELEMQFRKALGRYL